jgi:L-aminopeptidase/D-esterase-like protein
MHAPFSSKSDERHDRVIGRECLAYHMRSQQKREALMYDDITDVPGIRVGHDTNSEAQTGCTVILCDVQPTVGGVDVRGGAPGTRETDLLDPTCTVNEVHAIVLAGGSAFGLDAASGVMRVLETRGIGYDTGIARVPIVPAAVIFDLGVGRSDVRPDAAAGERAAMVASSGPIEQGRVGAGAGATVGKVGGPTTTRRGGVGSASVQLPDGLTVVGALVVVNALGYVLDELPTGQTTAPSYTIMNNGLAPGMNTTIAVVATSARLGKAQATKVAQMAHDGLARAIRPIHTPFDGDVVFALSAPDPDALPADAREVAEVGTAAADTLTRAVIRAVAMAAE